MNDTNKKCLRRPRRLNVVIVDPFPIFRRTLHKIIQARAPHVNIVETDTIDQAYDIIKTELPDIVFLDIAIFPKNFVEHIQSIKQQFPATVIVVLTSHDSEEHRAASLQWGADYFFSKSDTSSLSLVDIVKKASG